MSNIIESIFNTKKTTPSDINQHMDTLRSHAERCDHITEMGVRSVVSTWAFMAALPKTLISYDISDCNIEDVVRISKDYKINFEFRKEDVLYADIEVTDLLFIDTLHTYSQLLHELLRHSPKVKKYIILHDTVTFGYVDEMITQKSQNVSDKAGLRPAINDFLSTDKGKIWTIKESFSHNNGLTILERLSK